MHTYIAVNLIRHITLPSCDKFIEGLKDELNDPKVHSDEHEAKEKNFCRGGKKEGSRQKGQASSGPSVETGMKYDRAGKNGTEQPGHHTPSSSMPKRPPFDVRRTPPAHPVRHAHPEEGGIQGQPGQYTPAPPMPKCPPSDPLHTSPAPPVRHAGSGAGDSLGMAGTSSTSSVASSTGALVQESGSVGKAFRHSSEVLHAPIPPPPRGAMQAPGGMTGTAGRHEYLGDTAGDRIPPAVQ